MKEVVTSLPVLVGMELKIGIMEKHHVEIALQNDCPVE